MERYKHRQRCEWCDAFNVTRLECHIHKLPATVTTKTGTRQRQVLALLCQEQYGGITRQRYRTLGTPTVSIATVIGEAVDVTTLGQKVIELFQFQFIDRYANP